MGAALRPSDPPPSLRPKTLPLGFVSKVKSPKRRLGRAVVVPLAKASLRSTHLTPAHLGPMLDLCARSMTRLIDGEQPLTVGDTLIIGSGDADGLLWYLDFWERCLAQVVTSCAIDPRKTKALSTALLAMRKQVLASAKTASR